MWACAVCAAATAAQSSTCSAAGNITLLVLWLVWFAILFYVQLTTSELKPFDPFEILGVDSEASEKDIKKAYRKLSLQYHPDKV